MKKNTGFVAILALGGIVLMYAAMNMDFSQMSVGGLWALAGLGVAMIAGIYVFIARTEDSGGRKRK